MKDLICYVADKNTEAAVTGLLKRHLAIGIRSVSFDVLVHPHRDPGLFWNGAELLSSFRASYQRGMLVLDAAWDGAPPDVQAQMDEAINQAGIADWARAVVITPELENWVWSGSPHVPEVLGWTGRTPPLREWLAREGYWPEAGSKPDDPKAALEAALFEVGKPRSSAIYRALAGKVSLNRCEDVAFQRFRGTLREWFGTARPG